MRGFKLWQLQRAAGLCVIQAVAAAKGGWPVCDPVVRLAGAAYGGSKETSTAVCGDEGRCVVCNLRKSGCSLIAYCCTKVCGEDRQVCCVQFAEKQVVHYLPIAVMATGTRSNVTPVVLREDTRPPAYGDKYFCLLYTSPSPRD